MDTILSNIPDSLSALSESSTSLSNSLDTVSFVSIMTKPIHDTFLGIPNEWASFIVPTVASIIVFVLGILIEKCHKKKQQKQETEDYRKTVFSWVEQVKTPISNQIKRIHKLISDINANTTIQGVRFEFNKSLVNKLGIDSVENLIKYFIFRSSEPKDDKRSDNVFNIVSALDFLSTAENKVVEDYELYQKQSIELVQKWTPVICELQLYIDKIRSLVLLFEGCNLIVSCCDEWKELCKGKKEVNIKETYDSLINPILQIYYKSPFSSDAPQEVGLIYKQTNELAIIYYDWDALNKGFAKLFKEQADRIEQAYNNLETAVNYFKDNTQVK